MQVEKLKLLSETEEEGKRVSTRRRSKLFLLPCRTVVFLSLGLFICATSLLTTYSTLSTNLTVSSPLDLVVVTAASSNHFGALVYLLKSLKNLDAPTYFYDIGLSQEELKQLKQLWWSNLVIRSFNFSEYPDYFNIHINAGEFAWKPVIVEEVFTESTSDVLWVDAGCYFHDLKQIQKQIHKEKLLFVSQSSGDVKQWTHPKMVEYFGLNFSDVQNKHNADATLIGFPRDSDVYETVILPWVDCAMHKECIAPNGSSRKNHRQDQSALTMVLHKNNIPIDKKHTTSIVCKCDGWMYKYIGYHVPKFVYPFFCLT